MISQHVLHFTVMPIGYSISETDFPWNISCKKMPINVAKKENWITNVHLQLAALSGLSSRLSIAGIAKKSYVIKPTIKE